MEFGDFQIAEGTPVIETTHSFANAVLKEPI